MAFSGAGESWARSLWLLDSQEEEASGHLRESSGLINFWNTGAEQDPGLWGCSFTRRSEGTGGDGSWSHQGPWTGQSEGWWRQGRSGETG